MKKKLLLLVALIVCVGLVLVSCDVLPSLGGKLPHTHSYSWIDNGDGTHVKHCSNEGCAQPNVNEGPHDWSDGDVCVCGAEKPNVEPSNPEDPTPGNPEDPVPGETHKHDYQWIDNGDGTHTQHCFNDGCDSPNVNTSSHSYIRIDMSSATCSVEGWTEYECYACNSIYKDPIATVDHESDGVVHYDAENATLGHWELCKYGCGTKLNVSEHNMQVTGVIAATCIDYAKDVYECEGCDYTCTVEDTSSALLGYHTYQAYVCIYCQQDLMTEYLEQFDNHGITESDPIAIGDELTLTLFIDYVYFNGIFGEFRYVQMDYLHSTNTSELVAALKNATNTKTSGSFNATSITSTNSSTVLGFAIMDDPNDYASLSPDNGYEKEIYTQLYSIAFGDYDSARSDSFDDFKYKQRTHSVSVTTSEQLFYAFSHGYLPIPTAGSAAERILNKAETVARNIMDDSMTDLEKLKAIYTWLVTDVAYDYGAYHSNVKQWHTFSAYYLEGVFDYGIAVCDGISKAYCVLAGIENITCVRVAGEIVNNGGGHAWNRVRVDANGDGVKEWYASDATWGNTKFGNGELFNLQYFLTTDAERSIRISETHNYVDADCDATTDVDPFEYFHYGDGVDGSYDFVIENQSELNDVIAYIVALGTQEPNVCFNVRLSADFCTTSEQFIGVIRTAMGAANLFGTFGYGFSKTIVNGQVAYVGIINLNFAN